MDDEVFEATSGLRVWTTRVTPGQAENFMKETSEAGRRAGSEILVIDGRLVFGSDHIRSALYHARKAIEEHRNASDSIAMETLLYSSGERQLSAAIKKMSVNRETENVVIIGLGGTEIAVGQDWIEMPPIPSSVDVKRLEEFGILDSELQTASLDRAVELVLEKVAAVDIMKR